MIFCGNYKIFKTIKKLRKLRMMRKNLQTECDQDLVSLKKWAKQCQRNVKGMSK